MTDVSKVVVLGCGPAGLIAAHAAATMDCDVRILSKPRKSFMRGAQYLHEPIPFISKKDDEFQITYHLDGTIEGYREKVYGVDVDVEVSPDTLSPSHAAWDIRAAYDLLWDIYGHYVQEWDVTANGIPDWGQHLTISSVPANLMCLDVEHSFQKTFIWSTDRAFGVHPGDNSVVCNGEESPAWYRSSIVQGWGNTEWPAGNRPPLSEDRLWNVPKPVSTNCDCRPDVMRVGRYGQWKKGVLSHEAYLQTVKAIAGLS